MLDLEEETGTLSWSIPDGFATPTGYRVESRITETEWAAATTGTLDLEARAYTFPRPVLDIMQPLTIFVRVIALGPGGTEGQPSNALTFTIPGQPEPATSERFDVTAEEVLATRDEMMDGGLDTWPDGQLGILPTGDPGVYDFYANQGDALGAEDDNGIHLPPGIGHTRGRLDDGSIIDEVVDTHQQITDLITPGDYVGGGKVYRVPGTGEVVMFYHHERYYSPLRAGETFAYYGSLGVAVSTGADGPFVDLGLIIEPDQPYSAERSSCCVGAGDTAYVVRNGQLYLYFMDHSDDDESIGTAVARTSLASFHAAIAARTTPTFMKYHQGAGAAHGSFDEPGLGGHATGVHPSLGTDGWNSDVMYSACRDEFIMVSNRGYTALSSQVVLSTSRDGITWTTPERLYESRTVDSFYNTLVGDDSSDPKRLNGSAFSMLVTSFADGSDNDRWGPKGEVELRRVKLVDHVAETEGCRPTLPVLSIAPTASGIESDDGTTRGVYFQLALDRPSSSPVTVTYWTEDGSASIVTPPGGVADYLRFGTPAVPRTATIAAGSTQTTISVTTRPDAIVEADETFKVHIGTTTADILLDNDVATATILDADSRSGPTNDPVLLLTPGMSMPEGDVVPKHRPQVIVELSKPASVPITISYWTSDGTAIAGVDYMAKAPTALTFAVGQKAKTIEFQVTPNSSAQADRAFHVNYSIPAGAPAGVVVVPNSVDVTIHDDDT